MDAQRIGHRVETRDRKPKTVLEIQPADLAVGDDIEADGLLEFNEIANTGKLDLTKRVQGQRSIIDALSRFPPGSRPQQAADHIGPYGAQFTGHRIPPVLPRLIRNLTGPRRRTTIGFDTAVQ